jgi:hypothetical protein
MRIAMRLAISTIAALSVTAAVADDHRPAVSKPTISQHHYKGQYGARGSASIRYVPVPIAPPAALPVPAISAMP